MWSKDDPADHVTMAWLAKSCNGIKQYRKVYSSITQTFYKITVGINEQKLLKNSSLKNVDLKNTLLTLKNNVRALRKTQQL
jgi:hypothetical protein